MSRKKQSEKQSMSPMQRQAVLVCVVCALAALLTIGITLTLLKRGKTEEPTTPADSSTEAPADGDGSLSDHYQIDNTSSALLTETADAGSDYQDSTLFLGDSNTVRLYNNGLISLQQFCAKEGIGTQVALNEGIVTFKNDNTRYTIAQAVAKMKPRRVVMTFGTNDTGMNVEDFIANYTALVQAIQASYPYTDIIVNTVPPIPENHSNYPHMDQTKIDDFNMALLTMCEQLGVKFLNTAETLKGDNGYGKAEYYTDGDIHLKSAGLKAALNYLRTHAYQTEDRRPDTSNIPTRTMEYVSNPSSAVQAPSSEVASSSESASSSDSEGAKFEARYQVEKSGGGTLTCGGDSGKTSLTYSIADASKSLTVTAVPAEGHVFVKWSDGVTSRTRTDTQFKQNLDVTAVFSAVSLRISESKTSGNSYVFKATLESKYAKSENLRWFANGQEVVEAAGQTTVTVPAAVVSSGSYKIYAVVSYNDCAVVSNTLTLTVSGSSSSSSSSSTSSSSSESTSKSESTSSSTSSSSSSSSTSENESKSESSSSSHSSASSSFSSSESKAEAASSSHSESKSETASSSHSSSESESKTESKAESKSESKSEENTEAESASAENDLLPAASSEAEASW